jgi:hypothetical protein
MEKKMLPRRTFVITGVSFLVFGFIFLLNGFQGMTGLIVLGGEVDVTLGSVTGLWLVAAGLLMLWARNEAR